MPVSAKAILAINEYSRAPCMSCGCLRIAEAEISTCKDVDAIKLRISSCHRGVFSCASHLCPLHLMTQQHCLHRPLLLLLPQHLSAHKEQPIPVPWKLSLRKSLSDHIAAFTSKFSAQSFSKTVELTPGDNAYDGALADQLFDTAGHFPFLVKPSEYSIMCHLVQRRPTALQRHCHLHLPPPQVPRQTPHCR